MLLLTIANWYENQIAHAYDQGTSLDLLRQINHRTIHLRNDQTPFRISCAVRWVKDIFYQCHRLDRSKLTERNRCDTAAGNISCSPTTYVAIGENPQEPLGVFRREKCTVNPTFGSDSSRIRRESD